MFQWLTITTILASTVIFAERWMKQEKLLILKTALAVAVGSAVCILFLALDLSWLAMAGLLAGQALCLIWDRVRGQRSFLLPGMSLYVCIDAAFLPLCFGGSKVWDYAIYPAVLVLCFCLAPASEKHKIFSPCDFLPEKEKLYWGLSLLPCVILVPELLILVPFYRAGAAAVICLNLAFLCMLGLVLWLQQEIMGRIRGEELLEAMGRWQRESRDYMNTIRSQRHDFNLHLHAISGLINSGEYEKCREYAKKLVLEANAVNDIMPVNDAVVGSMLYNMRQEARSRGSDITYDITYDMEDIFCNGFECNKIIGNLLQNAIDALETPEDKANGIRLSILKRRGNTVIISENRFHGDPDQVARIFEPGYSTKKGHEGIGLSMVLRTVQRYGGRVYPEFDGELIRFVVNIPNMVNLPEGGDQD